MAAVPLDREERIGSNIVGWGVEVWIFPTTHYPSPATELMDNRRQAYRLPFAPEDALRIALRPLGKKGDFTAELVDLSVAGMRVRLRDAAPSIAVGDTLACRFLGRPESASAELNLTLSLSARIVHRETEGEATILGLQFLPTASPGANENIERTLNVFILAEQRRRRQRQRADEDRRP